MEGKNMMDQTRARAVSQGHENHEAEFNELWDKSEQNPVIAGLKEGKKLQEIMDSVENLEQAFASYPKQCGCADGRIHEHRCGRAGEGIVAGVEAMLEEIEDKINRGEISGEYEIVSHGGCGGAKAVCEMLKKAGKLNSDYDSDQFGVEFAKKLFEEAQKRFPEIKFVCRHLDASDMDELHGERAIYFDSTGKINIDAVAELPEGYIFTDMPKISDDVTEKELSALCSIALSDHGFGERFTINNPFRIIISGHNTEVVERQKEIAKKVAEQFVGRVKVESFIVKQ
jgi:hypothetical protein